MKKTRLSLCAVLLLGLYQSVAMAQNKNILQEQNLQELVVQGNRLQIQLSKQNRNIDVITAQEIQKLPARSVNEILSYISGVDIRQRGPFGSQADISVDGGSFEETLILLNGIKVMDQQTAHNTLNLPIPTEAIERIEILRGPAARVYGVNSLTGAINIVTKSPQANSLFANVFAGSNFKKDEEGSDALYNGRGIQLGGGIAKEKQGHQLYASHESGTGYRYNTAYHNNRVFYQGEVRPNQQNKIDVLAGFVRSSFGANGFYAAPGDKESKEIVNTTLVSIRSKHTLGDRFTLSPQIGYRYNFDDYQYYRYDLSKARSQHYSHGLSAEVNGNYTLHFGDIGFGAEMRNDKINSNSIGHHERQNYGLYAEFRTEEINKVNLNVGAYVNYNSAYGWQVFPGLDFSYQFQPGFRLVLNSGTSQRIPSFTDLYLQQAGNIGNSAVVSETAYQVEGGLKYDKQGFSAKAIVFFREIDDFIDWTKLLVADPWQANNVGAQSTTGLNVQAQYVLGQQAKHHWNFNLGYTYLSPEFKDQPANTLSKYKIESLRHQLVAKVAWQYHNWSVLAAERYQERISYRDYFLTDLRLNFNQKQFDYSLDCQNIFDKTYIEAAAIPMPGRWFSLGVKYRMGL